MKGVTSGILLAFLVTYIVTNGVNKVDATLNAAGDDQEGDSAAVTELPLCPVTDAPSGDNTSPSSVAATTNPADSKISTPSANVSTAPVVRKRRAASTVKCRNPSGSGMGLAGSLFGVTAGCVLVYLGVY